MDKSEVKQQVRRQLKADDLEGAAETLLDALGQKNEPAQYRPGEDPLDYLRRRGW